MDTEQCSRRAMVQNSFRGEDTSSLEKLKCISAAACDSNGHEGLDCSICLEFLQDPVATLCGHLFCWACIYKWLHFQAINNDENPTQQRLQQQQCPVCKCAVSHSTLVPLYGLGKPTKHSEGESHRVGLVIPRRPSGPACSFRAQLTATGSADHPQVSLPHGRDYLNQSQSYASRLGRGATVNISHPFTGAFEQIMYERMFASSLANLYPNQNTSHVARSSNPRLSSVARTNKSLSRICLFMCYCVVACLLLF